MSTQKHLEPIEITSDLTDEEADVRGVIGFAYVMNQKLKECREEGRKNWHLSGTTDPESWIPNEPIEFRVHIAEMVEDGLFDPIDVANYCMMIYHRERMEK